MKIDITVDKAVTDLQVKITCNKLTPEVERVLSCLRMMNHQLAAKKDGEIYLLDISKIIYIESVDRKCFVYTFDNVFETDYRLYELEQQLEECGLVRVSKSFLIHLQKIQSLKTEFDRKLRITMCNGEQIIASRLYADKLKKQLGVK